MSKAAQNARRVFTGVDSAGAVPIEYRFSHARNGNRHLVVVFANFTAPGEYGWSNGVLDKVRSNILWIRDLFDGANTYYLCKGMDFSLEQSVAGLISRVMGALSLTPDEVTMFGSSKGGSAALFFGLKYGFRNIVASVPQFLIGTYVREGIPGAAKVMMGEVTEQNVAALDAVLPELVRSGANRSANIYVITSPQDEQYKRQVEPFIGLFQGRENFNFVYNDSPLITDHGKVTLRNLPTIMGLLNLLVDGITPRIGMVRNGYEQPERDNSAIDTFLTQTSQVKGDSFPRPVVLTPAPDERVPANTVRFTGTAVGAVRVSFWQDGKYQGAAPVAADGSWIWERTSPWAKGRHVIRLFGADANNYQTERTEVVFTAVENASEPLPEYAPAPAPPPRPAQRLVLTVTAPAAHQQLPGPVIGFAGYAPGAVRVDFQEGGVGLGTCDVRSDGSWVWEPTWAWNEGDHFVEAIAVDAVGNASPWTAVPFTAASAYQAPAHGGYFNVRY
ncbi:MULTISPECIES: Ig-like domain-containing protein [unclassified Streptomyces]|uniref:hypothetical protein n=1 Tax=Streptomyces sp. NRRL F-4428 TaxID=1609137 RepID=UPI0005ECC3F9|nr:hypothetical protein [Streptomyces sp. NRRL F-4428]KJK53927.1 hypothetical protein UK14_04545 [Streptomyces sp. NRRL F-4428]